MSKNKGKSCRFRQSRLPVVAVITQDKGGEGKSLLAQALAEWARIHRQATGIVEVDTTGTSLNVLGSDVVGIQSTLRPLGATPARRCVP